MKETKLNIVLTIPQTGHIEAALVQYIDYLRDGDDDDKQLAKAVEQTYDDFNKQLKWA